MMQKVKEILEDELGLKPKNDGGVLKTHLQSINGNTISLLNDIYFSNTLGVKDVVIKRSGTGLTILISFEKEGE